MGVVLLIPGAKSENIYPSYRVALFDEQRYNLIQHPPQFIHNQIRSKDNRIICCRYYRLYYLLL
jgi:hypothetical protein